VKPASFDYARPVDLDEAIELLRSVEESRIIAGGQSLVPMLNLRLARPDLLVDIGDLALGEIRESGGYVTIGAGVTHARLGSDPLVANLLPVVHACIGHIGHEPIRRRGTIGGSLAHAEPTAELVTTCLVAGATVLVAGPHGQRRVALDDLVVGPFMTTLEAGELVVAVELQSHEHAWTGFAEVARRRGDFAIAAAACSIEPNGVSRPRLSMVIAGAAGRAQLIDAGELDAVRRVHRDVVALVMESVVVDVLADEVAFKRAIVESVVGDALMATGWFDG